MPLTIESFPHGGEHLDNDARSAHITLLLLAIFVGLLVAAIALGVRAF